MQLIELVCSHSNEVRRGQVKNVKCESQLKEKNE